MLIFVDILIHIVQNNYETICQPLHFLWITYELNFYLFYINIDTGDFRIVSET